MTTLDEMFEKAKAAYPGEYRQGDTVWQLVDAYVATKNYAYDDQLILQSRRNSDTFPVIKNYSGYLIDMDEME